MSCPLRGNEEARSAARSSRNIGTLHACAYVVDMKLNAAMMRRYCGLAAERQSAMSSR